MRDVRPVRRRRRALARASIALAGLVAGGLTIAAGSTPASSPPAGAVSVPAAAGQSASDTWSGTIPPGANPTSDCTGGASLNDEHVVTVTVPPGAYATVSAQFTFSISWTPTTPTEDTADEVVTVVGPDGKEVGSGDSSATTETVAATNLPAGDYHVLACGFANAAAQPYTGSVTVTTTAATADASVPSANARGFAFSAAVPADNQRDEAEPLMEIDKDGNIYTCGPTGFSNAADYAQVSTDGGKQFHLLGTPPRGQQGAGGGGDCGVATAVARNGQQHFQYAYTGLGPLTGFVTSTSPNNGHSLMTGGPFGNGVTDKGGGADRQWMTFLDDHTVLLSYNQQVPRNAVVQRSTDGGLTYGPNAAIAAPNPRFPGPMRFDETHGVVFFGWDGPTENGDSINLSVSKDGGRTWTDCRAALAPADAAGFVTADSDSQGNIYVAYGEEAKYHTYMVSLHAQDVAKCSNPATNGQQPTVNPGFSAPVQVDRDAVRTTVFPWIAAGGAPGRVAVTFYGTTSDGNPNTGDFKAAWDVYANQSVNALAPTATFSQVKATTHPFHYDSICLNGLGCDLSVPPGDRSLADFFAIDYNRVDDRLSLVFDRANKKPDEPSGHVGTPMVATQIGGPSNGGKTVAAGTPVVRTSSTDATNDALSNYSLLAASVVVPPTRNDRAADFTSVAIGPAVDPATGRRAAGGGFTVTMRVADLSAAARQQALVDTSGQSLLWLLRFTNGYQDAAASARWNPVDGFTFGFNDYTTGQSPCVSGSQTGEKCIVYPGDTAIPGAVDTATGTIRLTVPRALLRALGPRDANGRPSEVPATAGSRLYDATAFSLANTVSPRQNVQSFLYPLDNAPAMDFLLPAG